MRTRTHPKGGLLNIFSRLWSWLGPAEVLVGLEHVYAGELELSAPGTMAVEFATEFSPDASATVAVIGVRLQVEGEGVGTDDDHPWRVAQRQAWKTVVDASNKMREAHGAPQEVGVFIQIQRTREPNRIMVEADLEFLRRNGWDPIRVRTTRW